MAAPTIPNGNNYFFSTTYEGNSSGRRAGKLVPFEDDATIANSCVFDAASNVSLTRTPSSAGNRKTFTVSVWAKRSVLGDASGNNTYGQRIFNAGTGGTSFFDIKWSGTGDTEGANRLHIREYSSSAEQIEYWTNRRFEDVNKYYHILLQVDTTQSTSTDRIKLYVDGQQITSWYRSNAPSQDFDTQVNATVLQNIGRFTGATSNNLSGYLAEFNLVDGSIVAPSTFGLTNTTTGRWIPKTLTGITYGTNGFRLKFQDSSALGDDTSGNGNDYTSSNLASTDQTLDSPTNNHACLDPNRNGGFTYSEGNRQITIGSGWKSAGHSMQLNTGKWYWEFKCTALSSNSQGFIFGFAKPAAYGSVLSSYVGGVANSVGIQLGSPNYRYVNGSWSTTGMSNNDFYANGFVQVAYDADAGNIWFGVNNTWINDANGNAGNPATGANPLFTDFQAGADLWTNFFHSQSTSVGTGIYNWGQTAFNYTPPTGFVAVKQDNFPDLPTGVGIPDLTWIKDRDSTQSHYLVDTSRGLNKYLSSDATTANTTEDNGVVKMLNGGFELSDANIVNYQNNSFVGWNWVGNSGSTSSNTEGSVTSTVQANTTAGFSIIEATAPASGNFTIGHGLSSAPDFFWLKMTGTTGNWVTFHHSIATTSGEYMLLDTSGSMGTAANAWGAALPTSSVIGLGAGSSVTGSQPFVIHAWHEVSGFSKFGKYEGNNSTNGTFVYTGFKPAFVIIKSIDGSSSSYPWATYDSKRSPLNPVSLFSEANSNAVDNTLDRIDFLSNGFKCRQSYSYSNAGETYIYIAFAQHPFMGDGTNPVTAQ